jgi:hypothetical protein
VSHNPQTGRKDHWLPQGYMRGFISPSRVNESKPLYCFEKEIQEWKEVSTKEIGQGEGFYDYAEGTSYSTVTHPDSVFGRLERQYRSKIELMARDNFATWHRHKSFLLEFMHMLRGRSPMAMEQQKQTVSGFRVVRITNIVPHPTDPNQTGLVLDTMTPYPMPEPAARNTMIARMLEDVQSGLWWSSTMDWCLRYIDDETNPFCSTDQAVFIEGSVVTSTIDTELMAHPDTVVFFPLCWQACLFGSPGKFDVSYDRADPRQPLSIRQQQKKRCDRFVISPIMF